MRFKPPNISEVEEYVREKGLHFSPKAFIDHYEAADPPWTYYDRKEKQKPVRNWKQKALLWESIELNSGRPHPCSHGSWRSCKKPGVYPEGRDRDGHQLWRCIDHKPKPKPLPAEHPANTIKFKQVPQADTRSKSDKVNEQRKKLGL